MLKYTVSKPEKIFYIFALVLFFGAVNFHLLFLDLTVDPGHGFTKIMDGVTRHQNIFNTFTADPIGTSALLHFDQFAFDEIANQSLPYWNPYTLLGLPFLAEFQWGIFYPFNYIRMLLPDRYWDFYPLFHLLILSLVIFFLAVNFYDNRRAAFIASISIFGSGFFLSYLPTYTIINVIPWGFLLILSIEGLIRSPSSLRWSLGVVFSIFLLGNAGFQLPISILGHSRAEHDIVETPPSSPDYHIAWRWIVGSGQIPSKTSDIYDVA